MASRQERDVHVHHTQRSAAALFLLCVAAVIPIGLVVSGALATVPVGVRLTVLAASVVMLLSAFVFSILSGAWRR